MTMSCTSSYQPTEAPLELIVSATNLNKCDNKDRAIFRSSAARTVLCVTSITLMLFASPLGPRFVNSSHRSTNDLSNVITNLTEKEKDEKLAFLERELQEKKIELAWEKQHVDDETQVRDTMHDTMHEQISTYREGVDVQQKALSEMAHKNHQLDVELNKEKEKNAELKLELDSALEELTDAPYGPAAASRGNGRNLLIESGAKNLRGVQAPEIEFQLGDSIEIILNEEGGEITLHPGIIHNINQDETYDLVILEESTIVKGFQKEQFQTYHNYQEGMKALYKVSPDLYWPITIVNYIKHNTPPEFELQDKYQFTHDNDEKKEIHRGSATRMHRFAGTDGQ